MAGGSAVTKEPGTDRFAVRFQAAGFAVLAFDYRHLGESGGHPRQVVRVREQLADWQAAIGFAAGLPGTDPAQLVVWGFSLSGGHVLRVAARHPQLVAVIAQTPLADGPAARRSAARHTPRSLLRLAGRPPLLVPLAGPPGSVAAVTTPDGLDGDRALNPGHRYPGWRQVIAARSALRAGFYRPGRYASRVRVPLLVLVCDQDQTALAAPAIRVAQRAPHAELIRLPGGHYAPFLDGHERAVAAELSFLRHHLLERARADHPAVIPMATAVPGGERA
jgi:pimeloyl-ACP methyl ester carboxylesterase